MSSHSSSMNGVSKKQKRQRPLPPDVVARNLAIEKKRRESLNCDFLDLARLLPSLAGKRRISRTLIVSESVEYLQKQRNMCISAAHDMEDLLTENNWLVSELNTLRSQISGQSLPPYQPKAATEAMTQLLSMKEDICGTFPAGFGDNWAIQYNDNGSMGEETSLGDYGKPIETLEQESIVEPLNHTQIWALSERIPLQVENLGPMSTQQMQERFPGNENLSLWPQQEPTSALRRDPFAYAGGPLGDCVSAAAPECYIGKFSEPINVSAWP